jgi:hypothetical protein
MRSLLAFSVLTIALSAGVAARAEPVPTPPPGVSVQMLDARRAHVVFTGPGSEQTVRREAMLSAAAMTLDQRGTWFRIDTEWVDDHAGGTRTVALAVKFGEGPTPNEANAYDATEVAQSMPAMLQASR